MDINGFILVVKFYFFVFVFFLYDVERNRFIKYVLNGFWGFGGGKFLYVFISRVVFYGYRV